MKKRMEQWRGEKRGERSSSGWGRGRKLKSSLGIDKKKIPHKKKVQWQKRWTSEVVEGKI